MAGEAGEPAHGGAGIVDVDEVHATGRGGGEAIDQSGDGAAGGGLGEKFVAVEAVAGEGDEEGVGEHLTGVGTDGGDKDVHFARGDSLVRAHHLPQLLE